MSREALGAANSECVTMTRFVSSHQLVKDRLRCFTFQIICIVAGLRGSVVETKHLSVIVCI